MVYDMDITYIDDVIDAIFVSILPSSLGDFTYSEEYSGMFGFGKLTARYRVDCQDNFYGKG